MDATGEALDLFSQGKGLMRFVVSAEEPRAANARAKLASNKEKDKDRPMLPVELAKVVVNNRTIEGPLIGLDQLADYSHGSRGPGTSSRSPSPACSPSPASPRRARSSSKKQGAGRRAAQRTRWSSPGMVK